MKGGGGERERCSLLRDKTMKGGGERERCSLLRDKTMLRGGGERKM